jgi:hypothetical protein
MRLRALDRIRRRRYGLTEKGKATGARYRKSPKGRLVQWNYKHSPKGAEKGQQLEAARRLRMPDRRQQQRRRARERKEILRTLHDIVAGPYI